MAFRLFSSPEICEQTLPSILSFIQYFHPGGFLDAIFQYPLNNRRRNFVGGNRGFINPAPTTFQSARNILNGKPDDCSGVIRAKIIFHVSEISYCFHLLIL